MSLKTFLSQLSLIILVACSSAPVKKAEVKPEWMNSASKHCEPKGFLCASSEAKTSTQADLRAKGDLAAIFETKIESETTSTKSLSSKGDILSDYDLREQITKSVREKTSQVLNGVKVIERAQVGESFYSLAGLDILLASKFFRDEIKKHDERLEYLWEQKRKTDYNKMLEHYYQREAYNKKLSVLSIGRKSPISLNQLDQLKSSSLGSGGKLLLVLDSVEPKIADRIRGYMAGLGYQLVLPGSGYNYKIIGEMKKQKEFFKVKGFSKVGFIINLRSYDPKGTEIGGLSVQRKGIGRTTEDAFSRVEPEISKYIENNLTDLRLGE